MKRKTEILLRYNCPDLLVESLKQKSNREEKLYWLQKYIKFFKTNRTIYTDIWL